MGLLELLDIFFRWRGEWDRSEPMPESLTPSLHVAARYVLTYCRRRYKGLDKLCGTPAGHEDALQTVCVTLLEPKIPFDYRDRPRSIVYFGQKSKSELIALIPRLITDSMEDLRVEPSYTDDTDVIEGERVQLWTTVDRWCTGTLMQRKWVILSLLRQHHSWEEIVEILTCSPSGIAPEIWHSVRCNLPLPDWQEVHGWFHVPPPTVLPGAEALRQFHRRFQQKLTRDIKTAG